MSQLIQLKSRISAIATIKKITNAMRIISMSMHSKLGHKIENLSSYESELKDIFTIISNSINKNWKSGTKGNSKLLIIIGSDKGLCGSFNSSLSNFFLKHEKNEAKVMVIGKKIKDLLKNQNIDYFLGNISFNRISAITDEIFETLKKSDFSEVSILYTESKNFFIQKTILKKIIPVNINKEESSDQSDYIWETSPEDLYETLKEEYIRFAIRKCLFESLFSEQAARFRSMDNANRSAENLLEDMKIQYSKLRQTKITGELNELSSHF